MILTCDASQLEWRTVLELSKDPVGIQEILDGADTHSLNQVAFSLPSRLIAKIYLFRTIFNWGKGYAFTIDPDFMHVSTSVKYWDEVGKKFYSKYAQLDNLYHKNLELILKRRPIVGPLGGEWLIDPVNGDGDFNLPYTKAVNYPTQGTGAQVMMVARISLYNRIKRSKYADKAKFISTVHDSISYDLPDEYVEPIGIMCHEVFRDLQLNIKKLFNYEWIVPLACEVKVGENMMNTKKLDIKL